MFTAALCTTGKQGNWPACCCQPHEETTVAQENPGRGARGLTERQSDAGERRPQNTTFSVSPPMRMVPSATSGIKNGLKNAYVCISHG